MTTTGTTRTASWKMSARDLINIGLFAAFYIVLTQVVFLIGFINPVMYLVGMALSIIAGGIPFVLFLTRVTHPGMILLFAVIVSGLFVLLGHPPTAIAVAVVAGLLAEVVVRRGDHRTPRSYILAYTVFAVWNVGTWLPLFYDRENFLAGVGIDQLGPEYAAGARSLFTPELMAGFLACTLLFGLLGGLLGVRLLRKHFRRAGLA